MIKKIGVFGTSDQFIGGNLRDGINQSLITTVSHNRALLYLYPSHEYTLLGTVLNVSKSSRTHDIVCFETMDESELTLNGVMSFYQHARNAAKKLGYTINSIGYIPYHDEFGDSKPSEFHKILTEIEKHTDRFPTGITSKDDILSYLFGRHLAGKKVTINSASILSSILCLITTVNHIPKSFRVNKTYGILMDDNGADVIIHSLGINAAPMKPSIPDNVLKKHAEFYKLLGDASYQTLSESTNIDEFISQVLLQYGTDDDRIDAVSDFCETEMIPCPKFINTLNNVEIRVSPEIYTGKEIKPVITITRRGKILEENHDYLVDLPKGRIDVGEYPIKIYGAGKYEGIRNVDWRILPLELSSSNTKVSFSDMRYTGSEIRGVAEVKVRSIGKLVESVHYTVEGKKSGVCIGTYAVRIVGIGNYSGSVSAEWKIVPEKKGFSLPFVKKNDSCSSSSNDSAFVKQSDKSEEVHNSSVPTEVRSANQITKSVTGDLSVKKTVHESSFDENFYKQLNICITLSQRKHQRCDELFLEECGTYIRTLLQKNYSIYPQESKKVESSLGKCKSIRDLGKLLSHVATDVPTLSFALNPAIEMYNLYLKFRKIEDADTLQYLLLRQLTRKL